MTATRPFRDELTLHLPSLHARALKLCLNATEAQDLVQDTVERALRFESSYQPGTNLRAWAQQVLFSVFVTRCRKNRRERRALEVLTTDPCAWTRPDASPAMVALSPRVERAISELPEAFESVVRLVDLAELSYKDAAERLGIPVGTVMSRLFRGRRLLAAVLDNEPAAPAIACAA
ncbi:MAG: RNA polymerase sigma factor [Myxococcales bacterium]|nr:RNA polymerase sigma factor [Myxococcales bacterium]MCB9581710.1 RNA polymerase sigma factor [Polyangiaceae bacterium]